MVFLPLLAVDMCYIYLQEAQKFIRFKFPFTIFELCHEVVRRCGSAVVLAQQCRGHSAAVLQVEFDENLSVF